MPTGEPNLNLPDIAKEGIAMRLRSAPHAAVNEDRPVVLDQVPVTREPGAVRPRHGHAAARRGEAEPLLAVIFEDIPRPAVAGAEPCAGRRRTDRASTSRTSRGPRSRTSSPRSRSYNPPTRSPRCSNEEVVSTNEELQSTNEESETSKEELQSVNEELTTVNSQLQDKAENLAAANSDLANLLKSTRIATLFLDGECGSSSSPRTRRGSCG